MAGTPEYFQAEPLFQTFGGYSLMTQRLLPSIGAQPTCSVNTLGFDQGVSISSE
jgi:hypothetical protein